MCTSPTSPLFLLRGQPVIYYGDEQGFTGHGGDNLARQDMFASRRRSTWRTCGSGPTPVMTSTRMTPTHPTYQLLARLAELRAEHPALADGALVQRTCPTDTRGVVAFSRIDRETGTEYVVALNNAKVPTAGHDRDLDPERDLHDGLRLRGVRAQSTHGPPPTGNSP